MAQDLEIHTIADLERILDENPSVRERIRRKLLTDEERQLHQIVAQLSAEVQQLTRNVAEGFAQINARLDDHDTQLRHLNDFVTEQREFNAEQREFNAEQREFNAEQREFNAEQRQTNANVARQINTIFDDLGQIRASHASLKIAQQARIIAMLQGLQFRRQVLPDELFTMVDGQDGVSNAAALSFANADVVLLCADRTGESHYLAIETSYTADLRDTRRAIRNAQYLERYTGQPATPVIASVRKDTAIQDQLDTGVVVWYQIPPRDLETD